jgi:predicted  nucleic acid-binding Zn-ribbon protein
MYIDLTHKDCIDYSVLVDENNKKYQNELDSLNLLRDSLEKEIIVAEFKSDSLRNSISARNKELNKLRKQYNETIAAIDSMSNDKLVEFLTNRYK